MNLKNFLLENRGFKQTIFKNTFWLGLAEIFTRLIGFFIVVWIARYFGPVTYGKFVFALSFVALFSVLADFGFSTLTVREIARDKSKTAQYIDNILAMKIILGLITLSLIALIIQFLGKESEIVKLVYFLGFYAVISTFAAFFQSIFRANEKMQCEAVCRVLQSLGLLGLVTFFLLNEGSILTISYAHIGSALIGISFSIIFVWRYFSRFFLKIDIKICKEILSEAWPFALTFIAISIYSYIDSVIIGVMKSNEEVGWYNAAYKLVLLIPIFTSYLVTNSTYPIMARLFKVSLKKLSDLLQLLNKLLLAITIPISVVGMLLASPLIKFFYGPNYKPGILVLQILIWSTIFISLSSIYGSALNACDRQKKSLIGVGSGAVISILLNLILIPKFSLYGAAMAVIITQLWIFLYMYFTFNKEIFGSWFRRKIT